jgi:hypothetical protein
LIAAGTGELVDLMLHQDSGALAVAQAAFDDRLRFVENVVLGRIGDSREALTAAVEAARVAYDEVGTVRLTGPEDVTEAFEARVAALRASVHAPRIAALRASVHGAAAPTADLDSLRSRVHGTTDTADTADTGGDLIALRSRVHGTDPSEAMWDGDGMPIDLDLNECLQASLRARAHPSALVARATSAWTAKEREKAASRGAAMPGGRFPIKDCTDVGKAVHALGRGKGDKAAIKRHILKRARSLDCMDVIPDTWK